MPERFHTTVTERGSFQHCHRAWYLETVQRLVPKGRVIWYFIFGDCIHAALEAYYRTNQNLSMCLEEFSAQWGIEAAKLKKSYGAFYGMGIGEEWDSYKVKSTEMLTQYHTFDRLTKDFDEVVDFITEERSFIEILDPSTGEMLPGNPLLSGRVDMIYRHKKRGLWVRDHKALSGAPVESCLGIDDQLTGYCYIYWRLTGEMVRGGEYNVLLKDPPKPPRVLVSGALSTDKAQRTTYELYKQSIKELGLKAIDYGDMLTFLSNKGWNQFFIRSRSERNIEQLAAFERKLFAEYQDMQRALEDPDTWAYPNQSQYVCPGCSVMPVCKAMDEGGDVESVIENGFEVQDPRTTIPEGV